jgi:hypothetical protein
MTKLIHAFTLTLLLTLMANATTSPRAQKRLTLNERDLDSFNYKVGDLYYTPSVRAKVGYDSNSNSSTTSDKDNGYYAETSLGFDFFNQPFRGLTLDTNFVIGYREGFGNNNDSGLVLGSDNGNATLGFDYDLSDKVTLSLVNEASVGMDKIADARDNENSDARQFWDNDLSLLIRREITEDTGISVKAGFESRKDLKNNSPTEEYDESYFGLTLDHIVNAKLAVDPFFNYSKREWGEDKFNNNYDKTEFGISAKYFFNDRLITDFTIAYQEFDFEQDAILKSKASSKSDGLVGSFILTYIATEKLTHSIRTSYDNDPTTVAVSNITKTVNVAYNTNYTVNERLLLSASFDWLHGEDQGNTNAGYEETYDIYMPSVGATYKFTPRQSIEFKCSYQNKTASNDSTNKAEEYERTNVFVNYTYTF